jgi:hypothetical protein
MKGSSCPPRPARTETHQSTANPSGKHLNQAPPVTIFSYSPACSFATHPSIHPVIHLLFHPSICLSTHPFTHPFIHSLYPPIHLYVHLLIHPLTHSPIHLPHIHPSTHLLICIFTYPSIHSFIHPYIHPPSKCLLSPRQCSGARHIASNKIDKQICFHETD